MGIRCRRKGYYQLLADESANISYDTSGMLVGKHEFLDVHHESYLTRHYDGDGREIKRSSQSTACTFDDPEDTECEWNTTSDKTMYYVRSSLLDAVVVSEVTSSGAKQNSFVLLGSEKFAYLTQHSTGNTVHYENTDALGLSILKTRTYPEHVLNENINYPVGWVDPGHADFDGRGANVGTKTPYVYQPGDPPQPLPPLESNDPLYIDGQRVVLEQDGVRISQQQAAALISSGRIGGMLGLTQILFDQSRPLLIGAIMVLPSGEIYDNFNAGMLEGGTMHRFWVA